jgi:hypothetical protein
MEVPRGFCPTISEGHSRLARKKASVAANFTCQNPNCKSYGTTYEGIYAPGMNGKHRKNKPFQDLVCQACGGRFTTCWRPAVYRAKTRSAQVPEVSTLLDEGLDVSPLERVWGLTKGRFLPI